MKDCIVITGQTATGKTQAALNLAHSLHGDIISADSRQIYKYLDIITGKDCTSSKFKKVSTIKFENSLEGDIGFYELNGVKVWGLDIISPDTIFSAYNYTTYVNEIINNTIYNINVPIIVGGTYFYIDTLLQQPIAHIPPNLHLRKKLEKFDLPALQRTLNDVDEEMFSSLNESDRQNPHRLIRKIEIAQYNASHIGSHAESQTDTLTSIQDENTHVKTPLCNVTRWIGYMHSDRTQLEKAISTRIQKRMSEGALQEVAELIKKGYSVKSPGLHTIGYTQLLEYIDGTLTLDEALEKWKFAEMHYAKRQYTLMKRNSLIQWNIL